MVGMKWIILFYFISLLKLSMPNEHVFKISSWAFHLYELYEFSFGHF
jgi:hypothetical protein